MGHSYKSLIANNRYLSRLGNRYDVNHWELPLPLWAARGYDHGGKQAWQILRRSLNEEAFARPMCIYLHIPFCISKCGFCDSYSFKVGRYAEDHIEAYVNQLCQELRLWSQQGNLSQRLVPSVHLGGGTPCFIGEAGLTRLVKCIRANFNVDSHTEWALETTVASLTPSMISTLHDLGFRRLHIGVQTLEPEARRAIGRRCASEVVLAKVDETLSRGWIVSVDLLCGLPLQTFNGFLGGIEDLMECGVNGFSLYELLIYPQNRRWAEKYQLVDRDHLPNYLMFTDGGLLLEEKGYRKNLFNHWADEKDDNIYFTYPTRDEDLLVAGTISDGVFGNYHYRHLRYTDYRRQADSGFPGLEGGLRRTGFESELQPLITALMSATIAPEEAAAMQSISLSIFPAQWETSGLIEKQANGHYQLTPCGSWFTGNMISELANSYTKRKGNQ